MAVKSEAWEVTKLGGEYPHLTSLNKTIQDPQNGKIYMYGGLDPGEENELPKPYFHVCDTRTMEFTDLTNGLTYCPPGNPYSSHSLRRKSTPLPALTEPGITFLEVKGHPMIFLFGGYDTSDDEGGPTSKLIAIHTIHKEWYYVEFENDGPRSRSPVSRIYPVLVGCNDKIYIFGGIEDLGDDGDEWIHRRSYSIVEFVEESHKCKWAVIDAPYPRELPPSCNFGKGLPLHNGSMILLLPGRQNQNLKVDFKNDNFYYFLPINNTFQRANIKGPLPTRIHWYYACNIEPLNSSAPPSILMCTWIPYDATYLSPEVWRLTVYPKDSVVCLDFKKKFFDLGVDFRRFSLIGNSMYLMGKGDDPSEGSDDGSGSDEGAMCDTYVRIPV